MRDAGRRPIGRLLYWALILVMGTGLASGTPVPPQSGANTTTVAEVRAHDYGWGAANDRNLPGRFGTQAFTLPGFVRTQNYFLRFYDASSPPRYSRYTAALHVDYPL
jgi:hypothetical protein